MHAVAFSKDLPNQIKFGTLYQQALEGGQPGKHVNPLFGEWLHGLPMHWTGLIQKVAAPVLKRANVDNQLIGISVRAP